MYTQRYCLTTYVTAKVKKLGFIQLLSSRGKIGLPDNLVLHQHLTVRTPNSHIIVQAVEILQLTWVFT